MRDHNPVKIDEFNGLFDRGDKDNVPLDHFTNANNIRFVDGNVLTRYGIGPDSPYKNVARVAVFNQSLLILDIDGNLYHNDRSNRYVPILSLTGMTDFMAVKFANRVYITPIGPTDFIYVYTYGDTAGARKIGGAKPTTAPIAIIGPAGNVEQGTRVFAVAYETDTGFITQLSAGVAINLLDGLTKVTLTIPVSPSPYVVARHIVSTVAIDPADFTGDLENYQFFFTPDGDIEDNTTTSVDVNFYDAELLEDASYLADLYDEVPNCKGINSYHQRLVAWAPSGGSGDSLLSNVLLSEPGQPEVISRVDGLIELQRDGRSITYCQEYRDVLYIFKQTKTTACSDNDDVPTSWPQIIVDQGIGSQIRGVATVMDSGSVNIEFLLVADYTGLILFDGKYNFPELSWKIEARWSAIARSDFSTIQVVIDSQGHFIYIVKPDGTMLVGDYSDGLDHKNIKWAPWTFAIKATSVVIVEEGGIRVVIGTKEVA